RFKYRIIRQIFQIMTYLSFQQPDKRIHPTDDTNQFANNHVNRMPLADMRTLVYQNLIDLFLGMAVGMQKYQPEKRKRTGRFIQQMYTYVTDQSHFRPPCQ